MKNMLPPFLLLTMIVICTSRLHCQEEQLNWSSLQTEIALAVSGLPFKPALPSNFVLSPFIPNGDFGLVDGIFWSTKENIENIWQQYQKDPKANFINNSGLIQARI